MKHNTNYWKLLIYFTKSFTMQMEIIDLSKLSIRRQKFRTRSLKQGSSGHTSWLVQDILDITSQQSCKAAMALLWHRQNETSRPSPFS